MHETTKHDLDLIQNGGAIFKHAEFNPILIILSNALKQINTITWIIFNINFISLYQIKPFKLKMVCRVIIPCIYITPAPVTIISAELYILGLNQISIFILSMLIGFLITVILYYTTIKFTPISWLVNGYRKSFFKIRHLNG